MECNVFPSAPVLIVLLNVMRTDGFKRAQFTRATTVFPVFSSPSLMGHPRGFFRIRTST